MRNGLGWALWVWVWVGLTCHTHTHSTYEDPRLYPRNAAVLTSTLQEQGGVQEASNHLALEFQGGEEAARTLAHKYNLSYVCQVFRDPPVYHLYKPLNTTHHHHHYHHHNPHHDHDNTTHHHHDDNTTHHYHHHYHHHHQPHHHDNIHPLHHYPHHHPHHQHHDRHHHRQRRSTTPEANLIQLLAQEPGVKWVNQQREVYRDKRQQVRGFNPSSSQARSDIRRRHPTNKRPRNLYNNMKVWQQEEELGLLKDYANTLKARQTHQSFHRGNIDRKQNSLLSDISLLAADLKATEREDMVQSNAIETNKPDESSYNEDTPMFNDPLFKEQWYLHNTGQVGRDGHDLNVTGAWRQGYTGQGVTLCILDDGLQTTNKDLAANYNPAVSYSLVRDGQPESDPSPRLDPPKYSNSHGTYCAGVVAAVANNGVCGVGVAYNASVGGVRIVDGTVTDVQEATALSRHVEEVAVFSASWGPKDDGGHVEGPGSLARRALLYGVTAGRGGLGTVYVWASGNGGVLEDNCNLDGYASSIYTLTVSALTDTGQSTFYAEPCAATLAGVFVGGQHTLEAALDKQRLQMKVVVPELDGHCSNRFQGSSAAAPLMAGVAALVLQANPNLSWRDVQHLVVAETTPTPAALTEHGWHTNARGKKFHLLQGFGAINAGRMVEAALAWHNVGPQLTENLILLVGKSKLPHGWTNVSQEVSVASPMKAVEQVVAAITLNHPKRSLLSIYIVSPSGTESQVLTHRLLDNSTSGFHGWGFTSVHLWGEGARGAWTVAIRSDSNLSGHLLKVDLSVYGY